MNLLESTEVVEHSNKVFVLRLNNGALVGTKISGSSDEDGLLFLDNPCFISIGLDIDGDTAMNMEPFIPVTLVKTTSGAMSVNNIMMIWEASEVYESFYNRLVSKFNSDLMNRATGIPVKSEEPKKPKKKNIKELIKEATETPEPEETNVITVDFKNRKKIEAVVPESNEEPDIA